MNPSDADSRLVQREIVLLVILAIVASVAFVFTREAARRELAADVADAAEWFAIGETQLGEGQAGSAVASLRRATGLDRDNRPYGLTLARALAANGQEDEAWRALLALRDRMPDDPDVNIALARLAGSRHDAGEAQRFYQNALYGIWPPAREPERTRLRVELIRFLLQENDRGRALSEVVALSTNLPDTASSRIEAGRLFLAAGDSASAFEHFTRALRTSPDDAEALAGAGESSFARGEYLAARRYFTQVAALPDHLASQSEVARLVLEHDPLQPRLTLTARRNRLRAAVSRTGDRLDECVGAQSDAATSLAPRRDEIAAFLPTIETRALRDQPELVGHGVDLVHRAQVAAARFCGEPQGLDRALRLIGERHEAAP